MKKLKLFFIVISLFLSFINFSYSETLEWSSGCCIWEGDVKKGKAHGNGILTFANGAVYEGKVSKNRIHGKGKLTTKDGEVYEGKWRYGKFKQKIDKKTRIVIELSTKGRFFWVRYEIKGKGNVSNQWFAAEEKSGSYVLTDAGKSKMEEALKATKDDGGGGGGGGC